MIQKSFHWVDSKFPSEDISQNMSTTINARIEVTKKRTAVVVLNPRWSTRSFPNTVEDQKANAASIA